MDWTRISKSIKHFLFNLLVLTLPSLILCFLLLELVIFRFMLPVSERPYRYFDREWSLMKLESHQSGTYRKGLRSEVKGKYRTNAAGWNSVHEYLETRGEATRIAVIGDSYVEAVQVDVDQAFPAILEANLTARGYPVEVYSFGVSGAALSEYLQIMRYVYQKFRPDIAIVNLFYNDFTESLASTSSSRYRLRFKPLSPEHFVSVPPEPYTPSKIRRLFGESAVVRFLYYQIALSERLAALKRIFINPGVDVEQNVELSALQIEVLIRGVTRHIFKEFKRLSDQAGVKLLLSIDAPRQYIYQNKNPGEARVYRLNQISLNVTHALGIEMIDLTDAFQKDYKHHRERFEFQIDGHWNQRGHQVVGQTLSKFLVEHQWLD